MRPSGLLILAALFLSASCQGHRRRSRGRYRIRAVQWWSLWSSADSLAAEGEVSRYVRKLTPSQRRLIRPLARKQRNLLLRNMGALEGVADAADRAITQCRRQMTNRRWNCGPKTAVSEYGDIVKTGCRETAFIYALTSASLVQSIAKACSRGTLHTCDCGRVVNSGRDDPSTSFQWGGCSDNVRFARRFSRGFLDKVEKGTDLRYRINLHNIAAGRIHAGMGITKQCKCHGVSGSCSLKTCWQKLPHLKRVAKRLRRRFDGATFVGQGNEIQRSTSQLLPVDANHRLPRATDLVYFQESPDFCTPDGGGEYGSTRGRRCNPSLRSGQSSCNLLCCGRGARKQVYTRRRRCRCKFLWCCRVVCDTCETQRVKYICR